MTDGLPRLSREDCPPIAAKPLDNEPDAFQKAWAEHDKSGSATGWEKVGFTAGFGAGLRYGGDTRELKAAANKLIDYCIAHDWGMMPEPYDSINPLLKLLGRFTERSGSVR